MEGYALTMASADITAWADDLRAKYGIPSPIEVECDDEGNLDLETLAAREGAVGTYPTFRLLFTA